MDGYKQLAAAIVERAALDYRNALKYRDQSEKIKIEGFFKSDWFFALAEIDGKELVRKIRAQEVSV